MKVTWSVILLLGTFASVRGLPATPREDEVEFIPLEAREDPIIIDTGVFGSPWSSPFDGLLESLAGMMARMRQQMDYLLRRFPVGNSTVPEVPFPGFPDIDLSKANTTSVTKMIDGHKVVINETEYKHSGENGGAFFKVRIIDFQPDGDTVGTTESNSESITVPPKEPESVESSIENEIPKNREIEDLSSIETFELPIRSQPTRKISEGKTGILEKMEDSSLKSSASTHAANSVRYTSQPFQKITNEKSEWSSLEPLESFEDNSIDTVDSFYQPPDLSRDTYVNQWMADSGAPINPDAEVFTPVEYHSPFTSKQKQHFEKLTQEPL